MRNTQVKLTLGRIGSTHSRPLPLSVGLIAYDSSQEVTEQSQLNLNEARSQLEASLGGTASAREPAACHATSSASEGRH